MQFLKILKRKAQNKNMYMLKNFKNDTCSYLPEGQKDERNTSPVLSVCVCSQSWSWSMGSKSRVMQPADMV